MELENSKIKKKKKRTSSFLNFREYLYWSYADLQINNLLDMRVEDLDSIELPFNYKYIPLDYPQPKVYIYLRRIL